jgi:hypothetical protein
MQRGAELQSSVKAQIEAVMKSHADELPKLRRGGRAAGVVATST